MRQDLSFKMLLYKHPSLRLLLVLIVFSFGSIVGCHRTPRPAGLPKLYNVTLKIHQEGIPLANADVMLYPVGVGWEWTHGGRTDENGVTQIVTHGQFAGVPVGEFKVTVSKNLVIEPEANSQVGMPGIQSRPNRVFDLVNLDYKHKETTPLVLKVQGKNTQEFDVGEPVRIEIKLL